MRGWKRFISGILTMVLMITSILPMTVSAAENLTPGHEFTADWIWSNDAREAGQWMSFRKTFDLDKVPEKVEAYVAADSKYWLWINGEMAVFEGMVKTGPNRTDMYYDKVDIAKYLKEGKNTIAVQVVYFGKSGYGFKDSGKPGFLFDAEFGEGALSEGTKIISDTSWKAVKDPAYGKHDMDSNYRLAEPNIMYDANAELTGWQGTEFNDSKWENAVIQAKAGEAPYNDLWERPIPQLKVDDVVRYTADGTEGTGTWNEEYIDSSANDVFTALELPDEYNVSLTFMVDPLATTGSNAPYAGSMGLAVNMKDDNNFYMPQVSMADLDKMNSKDYANYKPHIHINGGWDVKGPYDISSLIPGDKRFNTKHTMTVSVDANGFDATVDGTVMERVNTTALKGGSIGFRNDNMEKVRIYSLEVKSADNSTVLFKDNFAKDKLGKRMTQFKKLSGAVDPEIKADENGDHYLSQTNAIIKAGNVKLGEGVKRYTIRNATNLQGTPYLKVKAAAGKRIDMYTDTWKEPAGNGNSVRHAYITKDGEQEFEALGWVNGYDVYFEIPESVEVIELGFRPSTYNTTPAGSFTSEDEDLNLLYKKSYDTLLVTMRDNYMDCPDRERAQWWGDAVNEMQMAFYAMDSNAGLLYKKALNQVLGWKNAAGQLPTTAPNGIDAISELPMQALAGVMSFWQYYMYSGDAQPMTDGYDSLLAYLKLWSLESDGFVSHRGGTWDWMDWGNNPDAKIIEQEWYYIAAQSVLNMAQTLDKPEVDIEFLEERMYSIESKFDKAFWDKSKNAYYRSTGSGKADDRANALAVYAGLAPASRYADIEKLLETQMESSPYMEKYVLEALYMMGYDDEAMARTKTRYNEMIEDEFPTLWEFWNKNAGTRNHAWSGGPLTMMYMFNAGITPLSPAYESFQVRPQTAGLKDISAEIPSPKGNIAVTVKETDSDITLGVTVPENAKSADIYVPRMDGKQTMVQLGGQTIYAGGAVLDLPDGVTYKDEDNEYVAFTVESGTYSFVSSEYTGEEKEQYDVNVKVVGQGTIQVDGADITVPYQSQVNKGETVTITATPAEGWAIQKITGTYPEIISDENSKVPYTKEITVDRNVNFTAVFTEIPKERHVLTVDAKGLEYAANVKINGVEKRIPFAGAFKEGQEVTIEAEVLLPLNYEFSGWSTETGTTDGNTTTVTIGREDVDVSFELTEKVEKITPVIVTVADRPEGGGSWDKSNLVDGQRISTNESNGFTSQTYSTKDISKDPHNIVLDLGEVKSVNQVALFPRTNAAAGDNLSCAFPECFKVYVSTDNKKWQLVRSVVDQPNPRFKEQVYSFASHDARYIKITTTRLGDVATDEGSPNNFRVQLAEIEVYSNPEVMLPSKDALISVLKEADDVRKTEKYLEATLATQEIFDEAYHTAQAVLEEEDADADKVIGAQQGMRNAIDGLIPAPKPITLVDEVNGISIYAEAGVLPDNVELKTALIEAGHEKNETVTEAMKDVTDKFTAFDITLWAENIELSLGENHVTATMTVPAGYDTSKLALFYVSGDGEKTELSFTYTDSNKTDIRFQADLLGSYVLADGAGEGGDLATLSTIKASALKSSMLWDETTRVSQIMAYDTRGQIVDLTNAVITYDTSNGNVAAVDETGLITAKNTGTAKIFVNVTLDEMQASGYVRVTSAEPQIINPVKAEAGKDSITLQTADGYEYALWTGNTGLVFTDNPVFTGLNPATEYVFYQRIAANENHIAGNLSEPLSITTDKEMMTGQIILSGTAKEGETLTVNTSGIQNAKNLVYVWKRGDQGIQGANGTSYKLTKSDVGQKISVVVTSEIMAGIFTATTTEAVKPAEVTVTGVTLDKTSMTLEKGKSAVLHAAVVPANATNQAVTFKSSKTSVVTVSQSGKISAKKAGTAVITVVSANGKTAVCKVTVTQDPTGVKLNRTSKTLGVKETYTLKPTLKPSYASNKKYTWTSSNKKVVKVNSKGKLTAGKVGTATITVKTSNGKKAICKITVKKAPVKLTLNEKSKTLKAGRTFALKAKRSSNSAGKITYTSKNPEIATVNSKGVIKAVKKGKTIVKAKLYNGKSAEIKITVQ